MSDPILLDGNVLDEINRGNKAAADALVKMSRDGRKIYITQQAYNEMLVNCLPRQATANRIVLEKFGITIAPAGPMAARVDLYSNNQTPKGTVVSLPDSLVAAQAKALNAELWSFDKAFRNNPAVTTKLGVKIAPETALSLANSNTAPPQADYRVGHKLLGLPPVEISVGGRILPPAIKGSTPGSSGSTGGGGSGSGTKAYVGVANNRLPPTGGPSASGQAKIAGIQLAFKGINFILNEINDHIQGQRVREALEKLEPSINQQRVSNESMGTLLMIFYTQIQGHPDSAIQPGAVFSHIETSMGRSRDEALENWRNEPKLRPGLTRNQNESVQEVWIPAIKPADVGYLRTPFPVQALGRFASSTEAIFQDVEWGGVTGFDDEGTSKVTIDANNPSPLFVVLMPRAVIRWYNGPTELNTDIPLVVRKSSDGTDLTAINLDPWMPGSVTAVPVFPADSTSDSFFSKVIKTRDNLNLLGRYPNFGKVRWIRPENIRVVRTGS